jgi:hypothetical protein
MASACPPIADAYPYGSIFELNMESSKASASSNTQPLGFTACLKPSEVEAPASTDDRQFLLACHRIRRKQQPNQIYPQEYGTLVLSPKSMALSK